MATAPHNLDDLADCTYRLENNGRWQGLSAIDRFWMNVLKTETCWLWTASKDSCGYGHFWWSNKGGKAHRFSWETHNGKIPKGMNVLHRCDNPGCVRLSHLFLGTQLTNIRDMEAKNRGRHLRGELNGSAKLTLSQVKDIRGRKNQLQRELAKEFKVTQAQISLIIRGEAWK